MTTDKKRILIVDDEEDIVNILKFRLEANNYSVLSAFDGQDALERARSERPDLIILDLMLPKLDGYKVCRALKSDENYKDIPIIIFTARAHEENGEDGGEIKADAYVAKPFEPQELLEKIRGLLAKT
ncbi:MAG: response regulator [Candidatus Omnitrophota bacterium]